MSPAPNPDKGRQLSLLDDGRDWNPYFAAYARSLGMAPGDIAPGGRENVRYVEWIRGQRAAWAAERGLDAAESHLWAPEAHEAFDARVDAL